jgi:hypothetical protein
MRSLLLAAIPLVLLVVASLTLISGCGQWLYADKVISVDEHELTVAKGLDETVEIIEIAPDVEVVLDGEPAVLQEIQPGDLVKVTKQTQGEQEFAVKIEAKRVQEEDAARESGESDELTESPEGFPEEPTLEEPGKSWEDEQEVSEHLEADQEEKEAGDSDTVETEPDEEGHAAEPCEEASDDDLLFVGVITFLDAHGIRVQGDAESDDVVEGVYLTLTDATEITVAGESGSREDLQTGRPVTITAERSGDELIAKRVDVRPTPA